MTESYSPCHKTWLISIQHQERFHDRCNSRNSNYSTFFSSPAILDCSMYISNNMTPASKWYVKIRKKITLLFFEGLTVQGLNVAKTVKYLFLEQIASCHSNSLQMRKGHELMPCPHLCTTHRKQETFCCDDPQWNYSQILLVMCIIL